MADDVAQLTSIAQTIQTALTPVFLLTGIGGLLNVFNQRLARVSDKYEHLAELYRAAAGDEATMLLRHLGRLVRRRLALDASVMLAACGGAATCAAAFVLFLVTLRDQGDSSWLAWLFGTSLGCTMGGIAAFVIDTVLAWHGLRIDGPMPRSKP